MIEKSSGFDNLFVKILYKVGLFLVIVHYLRYISFLISTYIPWHFKHIDYYIFSWNFFFIRLFSLIILFFTLKNPKNNLLIKSSILWVLIWFLLSHQHDRVTFFIPPIIFSYTIIYHSKKYFYRAR